MGREILASDGTVDYGSTNSARPRETLSQDSTVRESMSTEWTDEKHCLYLKSMEASFINDLYSSVDTLGWPLQRQLGEKRPNNCISSGQYKVLRGGCWEKVNFENQKPQTNKENGPRVLLAHPWIQHFRSACREQNVLSCDLQERTSFGNLEVRGIGKMAFAPADLAANMKQFSLCRSDSVGSNTGSSQLSFAVFSTEIYLSLACMAYFRSCGFVLSMYLSGMLFVRDSDVEVTGQNFIDEDSEGEKTNHVSKAKRRKTNDGLTSSHDQVVPFGTHPSTQVVPKKSSSLGRKRP
ncbi:hypothetical protein RHSIM_Rhsim07G0228200 [Rhododendron simsii]|uniref:Uncharacterized protein n=1 Tax=Rhododendron simsii TaxID=118357 RepID=A0A834GZR4_RHOSS|nr:hypothetical protein RHSIM_Rhsim07G0228200 [Rhododendron simsii]